MVQGGQYLTFMLAGEEYGVAILQVQEIRGWEGATRLPRTPNFVLGVTNLRGEIVPVIDLRRLFGLEAMELSSTNVLIVLRTKSDQRERTVGIVVDAVSEVYSVDQSLIRPAPEQCGSVGSCFVAALAAVEDKLLLLLDINRVIACDALMAAA